MLDNSSVSSPVPFCECIGNSNSNNHHHASTICGAASLCLAYAHDPNPFATVLAELILGLCWSAAYAVYIAACVQRRAYVGVPPAALFLNVAWEFAFSFVWKARMGAPHLFVNRVWLCFDAILLYHFGRREFRKAPLWYALLGGTMVALLACFIVELHDYNGVYMAFFQNLVMSMLFCRELWTSITAAAAAATTTTKTTTTGKDNLFLDAGLLRTLLLGGILRLVGTMAASYVFWVRTANSILLPFLYLANAVWDVAYVLSAYTEWRRRWRHKVAPSVSKDRLVEDDHSQPLLTAGSAGAHGNENGEEDVTRNVDARVAGH